MPRLRGHLSAHNTALLLSVGPHALVLSQGSHSCSAHVDVVSILGLDSTIIHVPDRVSFTAHSNSLSHCRTCWHHFLGFTGISGRNEMPSPRISMASRAADSEPFLHIYPVSLILLHPSAYPLSTVILHLSRGSKSADGDGSFQQNKKALKAPSPLEST